jgi:hypothetical protein
MKLDFGTTIAIVSLIVATGSAVIAWRAVRAAERTNTIELIGQLYAIYQSASMLSNLKTVWDVYREIWIADSDTRETAIERVNKGVPVRLDSAIAYFKDLEVDSREFRAIHNVINFWTYLELLLRRKALSPQEVEAFTSPRVLGILSPMTKAYDARYGVNDEEETGLGFACQVFGIGQGSQG